VFKPIKAMIKTLLGQNYAIDVEIKPEIPYTGEHITFIVHVWNTTKKGYKGASVDWEVCTASPSENPSPLCDQLT
jgi:hypothetical protein